MELLPLAINVLQGRHDENKNVIYFRDAEPAHRIAGGYEHRCGRRAGGNLCLWISKSYPGA